MKEIEVIEHLEKYGLKGKLGNSIWTMPKSLTSGLAYINANFMYQILNFGEEQISIIGINQITNKIIDQSPSIIPMDDVKKVSFKKGILFNKLTISTINGDLTSKVMKNIMNKKWHKINYNNLLELFDK